MQAKLTPIAKILLGIVLGIGLFFGVKYVMGQKDNPDKLFNGGSADTSSTIVPTPTFSYAPAEPINGTLKGVVELGASGFNSFVVNIDANKNWKLKKAEFGNSMVIEKMATDTDIRDGLKKYIGTMIDFGVQPANIQFVVSSGAAKEAVTQKIISELKALKYVVNTVTPEQEGALALACVLPKDYEGEAFVVDMGSSNTKVSWKKDGNISAFETYGSKYFQGKTDDGKVYQEVKTKCANIPTFNRKTCFIIGGVPFKLAQQTRKNKERFTVLNAPDKYKLEDAKDKAGRNIYKAIHDATGTQQFVFDWDANFSIGYLLSLK
jgi:hypothetical protein